MSEITAAMVRELREKSGAGMMDCKRALSECRGDVSNAVDWLRKKGLAAAGKKSSRIATEGVIAIATTTSGAVILELNSETDFVSKNHKFQELACALANLALTKKVQSAEALLSLPSPFGNRLIQEELIEHIALIGENISLRRLDYVSVSSGVVGSYIHSAIAPQMGKIGVLIVLESDKVTTEIVDFGKSLAMHIAASNPQVTTIDELDQTLVEKERQIASEQARSSGKPEGVIEKMVEGRIKKFYEEVVLTEQLYALDNKIKVSQAVANFAAKLSATIKIKSFVKYSLGEGIDKQQSDFAAEVAAMVK